MKMIMMKNWLIPFCVLSACLPALSSGYVTDVIVKAYEIHDEGSAYDYEGSGFDEEGSGFDDEGSGFDDEGSGFDDEGSGFDDEGSGSGDRDIADIFPNVNVGDTATYCYKCNGNDVDGTECNATRMSQHPELYVTECSGHCLNITTDRGTMYECTHGVAVWATHCLRKNGATICVCGTDLCNGPPRQLTDTLTLPKPKEDIVVSSQDAGDGDVIQTVSSEEEFRGHSSDVNRIGINQRVDAKSGSPVQTVVNGGFLFMSIFICRVSWTELKLL